MFVTPWAKERVGEGMDEWFHPPFPQVHTDKNTLIKTTKYDGIDIYRPNREVKSFINIHNEFGHDNLRISYTK